MVIFVDARLPVVEVGWRDPFGFAAGVFAGDPAAGFDQGVIVAASQRQCVDLGAIGGGPVLNVVDLALLRGCVAAGAGAATVLCVQHDSLPRRGQALRVIQRERLAVVEDRQVMVGVAAHADDIAHGQ